MVRIRLKRMGRRNRPFYRINAIEKRNQRDGKVLENLGWYDPVARDPEKQVSLKTDRIKHWLSRGASATDTVNDLLAKHEVIDAEAWRAERASRTKKNREKAVAEKKAAEEAERAAAEAAAKEAAEAAAAASAESSGDESAEAEKAEA
jgi:small subunit ribosomal protein S16